MSEKDKLLKAEHLCDCPFCGQKVARSIDENGETNGIMHTIPMCEKFKKLSAEEFIHAVYEETTKQGLN